LIKWHPVLWLSRNQGLPIASTEALAEIDQAVAGLKAQIEASRRDAQLLRASGVEAGPPQLELMRAARPPGVAAPAEEHLRSAAGPSAPLE
jgi:hypothetical protein